MPEQPTQRVIRQTNFDLHYPGPMDALERGLYEALITADLEAALAQVPTQLSVLRAQLDAAEAADRIALHVSRLVYRAIAAHEAGSRTGAGLELARTLIAAIQAAAPRAVDAGDALSPADQVMLRALARRLPNGQSEPMPAPMVPLLDTTLLTNAPGEPRVGSQLRSEIDSADRVDVLMAFIRRSGIRPLREDLRRLCDSGRRLRILTTTYTQSTEGAALEELTALGAEVRVSYDVASTRLHAKAWLFHRRSGYSTAYIGSSNLTHSAQVSGLEWNLRVAQARNPDVIDKFVAVFESYWESTDFRPFDPVEFAELNEAQEPRSGVALYLSPVELRPEPFQEQMLERLELSRLQGHHRNLLVAATGTGKTVMAAIDYCRLRSRLPRARLLYVAHRKEMLVQARATYRHGLRDAAFGEMWVDGQQPLHFEHVFASIQSLTAADLGDLAPDHFDVVVIDEVHHGAASSYVRLLQTIHPRELLGLTATPERSDGRSILPWFDDRIAAELRLWDAIDQQRLCPFVYYGVHDGLDLRHLPWQRGSGYDLGTLSNLVTGNHIWASKVLQALRTRIDDPGSMRALGFCVSVNHARFMAATFRQHGLSAVAIWADTPSHERQVALQQLASGEIQALFSVDLFNEGVDLPLVDTLLLLRPTDSPTLFLQQLGRGLRRGYGKRVCTVLDFVAQHRNEFRYDRRLGALLGGTRRELAAQVECGFPYLPSGCHMELDTVAAQVILHSLRHSVANSWSAKVDELRRNAADVTAVTLEDFLDASALSLADIYDRNHCWSELKSAAGLPVHPPGPHEPGLRRVLARLLHVDDPERIRCWRNLLQFDELPVLAGFTKRERACIRMLLASCAAGAGMDRAATLDHALMMLWQHPQVRAELQELLGSLESRIEHLHPSLDTHPDLPLQVHGRYTRAEILSAFAADDGVRPSDWREGVRWLPEDKVDALAFTLDKTSGSFSPTTRYRDYAISSRLIHWESQSTTRADSPTGLRYRRHLERGSHVFLFARLRATDRAFWFLGPASYVSHIGERPMAVTWRLQHPLPGDLYAQFAAAVA